MGLSNETTEVITGTKLNIVGGKFTLRVNEGTEGAESRELTKGKNEGKTVWELKYSTLKANLVGGTIADGEYPGVDINLFDTMNGDSYTINFPLDSRYLYDFIKRLPMVDTSKEIDLQIHEGKKKTRTGNPTYNLFVFQDDKPIKDYYVEWKKDAEGKNKATMLHGMPDAEKGIKGWSFEKQEEFLLGKFEEFFNTFTPSEQAPVAGDDLPADGPDANDEFETDVPF